MRAGFYTLLLTLLLASGAQAHEIRPAYLKITATEEPGSYDLVWKQPIVDGKRLKINPILPTSCEETTGGPGEVTNAALIRRWHVDCGAEGLVGKTIIISGLERTIVDVFVENVHINGTSNTLVVKPVKPSFVMGGQETGRTAGAISYFRLGVEHLLSGFDHILFIVGLVILVRTPLNLIKIVTSFTVAHSLTLGLATYGLVSLPQSVVEAVIALSILFLAVELVRKEDVPVSLLRRYPWAITFVFGLLHGFGFAGALTETGLPQGAAALALFLFNLGVEAGQLIIVALVLASIAALRVLPFPLPAKANLVPAYSIGGLGSFWFIDRTMSLLQ